MRALLFLFAALLTLAACSRDDERLKAEIAAQEEKIVQARTILQLEQKRKEALQDSLEINIRQNIALNMDSTAAASIENDRLELQGTIVESAKRNLDSQREFLALLKKRLQALR